MNLYRGERYGVFEGANGYYIGAMAEDGVSHYQSGNAGDGWSDGTLRRLNAEARKLDDDGGAL